MCASCILRIDSLGLSQLTYFHAQSYDGEGAPTLAAESIDEEHIESKSGYDDCARSLIFGEEGAITTIGSDLFADIRHVMANQEWPIEKLGRTG